MRFDLKSTLVCIAVLSGISFAIRAEAADLPGSSNRSTPIFATNWAGAYAGVHLGYGFGRARSADIDGFLGGAQVGINFQADRLVYGGELSLSYGAVDYRGFAETFKQKWLTAGKVRLGYAFERFLPFISVGLAYSNATMKAGGAKSTNGHIGYVLGIGGEMMLTDRVSATIQYNHYRFGSETYNVLPASRNSNIVTNEIRAGLNYRF